MGPGCISALELMPGTTQALLRSVRLMQHLGKRTPCKRSLTVTLPPHLGINSWQKAEVSQDPYVSTNRDTDN